MTEKDILPNKPQHNPLLTPEGYFESFTDKLMQRLPEQQVAAKPRFSLFRFVRYAAAAVVAAVCIGTGTFIYTRQTLPTQDSIEAANALTAQYDDESDDYLDEAIDYELINNSELAYYLTEAY